MSEAVEGARPTLDEAIARLIGQLGEARPRRAASESIACAEARGRVLAHDLIAAIDLPAFDNAAMDGYALDATGLVDGSRWTVVGTALAGRPFGGTLGPGQCVRIMTGAPLPAGTDTVVMREDTDGAAPKAHGAPRDEVGALTVRCAPARGANVRRRAEHVARGQRVLEAGRLLGGVDGALALSVGHARLPVRQRLRIGVLSTGDELADPPAALGFAGSYDANRAFLLDGCALGGFDTVDLGICRDDAASFERCVQAAHAKGLDVLLTTGGAAQGDADIVRRCENAQFIDLPIRPGRGVVHASLQAGDHRMTLLGLPGNAVAAFVMFHLFARPILAHMAGAPAWRALRFRLPLGQAAHGRGGRIDYRRGRLRHLQDGSPGSASGGLVVDLLADQGSAMLRTLVDADVLVALGPQAHVPAGEPVEVIALRGALG